MSSKASPSATTSENTTQQETTESQSKDTPKGDEDHGFDPLETNRTESYWIGKFNPYPGVNFSTDSNTIVESGKLCEKCTSMNECLGWALCLATKEERIAGWPLEFDHYETGILLEQSGQQGCHLCVLLWQAEIEADENWGPGEGAYSTRWAALREFRMLHVEALRPYTLRLRRSGGPHSLERKRNKATCKLAVGKGSLAVDSGIRLPISTASNAAISMAAEWLDECRRNHPKCSSKYGTTRKLPTRVIDIACSADSDEIRVISPDADQVTADYATLSYCWGAAVNSKLTSQTYDEFSSGVAIRHLPKTIRDAIAIVKQLGFRYLWVDSLCIMQDSIDDWNREAAMMSRVYEMSSLTIAALGASDTEQGCFALRDPLAWQPCWLFDDPKGNPVYLESTNGWRMPLKYVRGMPLRSRAWVLQEEMLSSRTLYFGDIIQWSCMELDASEVNPRSKLLPSIGGDSSARWNEPSFLEGENDTPSPRSWRLLELWCSLVENYMNRQLTFKSDRLNAFSGLLGSIKEHRGADNVAGLLLPFLLHQLLWQVPTFAIREDSTWAQRKENFSYSPSWSWLHLETRIQYDTTGEPPLKPWMWMAEVKLAQVKPEVTTSGVMRSVTVNGETFPVLDGRITISGMMIRITKMGTDSHGGYKNPDEDIVLENWPSFKYAKFYPDSAQIFEPPPFYYLPLLCQSTAHGDARWLTSGLVLYAVQDVNDTGDLQKSTTYRRLGILRTWDFNSEEFPSHEKVSITVI